MDLDRDDRRGVAREGLRAADQAPAGSSPPAARQRTTPLRAWDHVAADLRAACPDGVVLTWAQMAPCTRTAAQGADTPSLAAGARLKRRMGLNHARFRALKARKQGQQGTRCDGPTWALAVADLSAADHTQPTADT